MRDGVEGVGQGFNTAAPSGTLESHPRISCYLLGVIKNKVILESVTQGCSVTRQ